VAFSSRRTEPARRASPWCFSAPCQRGAEALGAPAAPRSQAEIWIRRGRRASLAHASRPHDRATRPRRPRESDLDAGGSASSSAMASSGDGPFERFGRRGPCSSSAGRLRGS